MEWEYTIKSSQKVALNLQVQNTEKSYRSDSEEAHAQTFSLLRARREWTPCFFRFRRADVLAAVLLETAFSSL